MKKIIALILALCMVFCFCACGNDEVAEEKPNDNSKPAASDNDVVSEEETAKFTVKVVDQNGDPVPNVMVQLCTDVCKPTLADANGVATFDEEITDEHKISLSVCPAGYETEYVGTNYIYLEDGITEYTFEITKK
ncbi:MAG: hypothetical protein IKT42_02705 [Clostridia bacterium]|nr:hypothetical protein [Clostridia bacterium]